MKITHLFAVAAALAVASVSASAASSASAADAAAKAKIAKAVGVTPEEVSPSPIPGIYEVRHDHEFGYATADGKYLLRGDLVNTETGEQITEEHRRADRASSLQALGSDSTIDFAPSPPIATKYTVTVFTDVDCPYCRHMHSQIKQYNALGIAVRYAFFPRTGPNTESWRKAEAVWCSPDRKAALTEAKLGKPISAKACSNPVDKDFKLGIDLGVRGTPMIFLPNGELIPGYVPPDELAKDLAQADSGATPAPGKMD